VFCCVVCARLCLFEHACVPGWCAWRAAGALTGRSMVMLVLAAHAGRCSWIHLLECGSGGLRALEWTLSMFVAALPQVLFRTCRPYVTPSGVRGGHAHSRGHMLICVDVCFCVVSRPWMHWLLRGLGRAPQQASGHQPSSRGWCGQGRILLAAGLLHRGYGVSCSKVFVGVRELVVVARAESVCGGVNG
jgi:hypothetical protein